MNRKEIYEGKKPSDKLLVVIACMLEFEKGQRTIENYISGKTCSEKWLKHIDLIISQDVETLKNTIKQNLSE